MFQMCGVFAQFERSMIVSRVNAGLKCARANGKTLGRPKIAAGTEASIKKALAKGDRGILKIAICARAASASARPKQPYSAHAPSRWFRGTPSTGRSRMRWGISLQKIEKWMYCGPTHPPDEVKRIAEHNLTGLKPRRIRF